MKKAIRLFLVLFVLCTMSGCGSILYRWVEEPELAHAGGVYRGVRGYLHEIRKDIKRGREADAHRKERAEVLKEQGDAPEPSVQIIGGPGNIVWGVIGLFCIADMLVLTPICDTVLLPYDLADMANGSPAYQRAKASAAELTKTEVLQIAETTVEAAGYDFRECFTPDYRYSRTSLTWSVYYEFKASPPFPGFLAVTVDDRTGKGTLREIILEPGE